MILNRVSRVMGEQRISVSELHRRTGLAYTTCYALYGAKSTRLDLATLDALCRGLGCGVGDLFEYVPDTVKPQTTARLRRGSNH
jgi:putative transcriptional regulator